MPFVQNEKNSISLLFSTRSRYKGILDSLVNRMRRLPRRNRQDQIHHIVRLVREREVAGDRDGRIEEDWSFESFPRLTVEDPDGCGLEGEVEFDW